MKLQHKIFKLDIRKKHPGKSILDLMILKVFSKLDDLMILLLLLLLPVICVEILLAENLSAADGEKEDPITSKEQLDF